MSEEFRARWHAAAHAMQSAIAHEMNYNPTVTDPKHLRVGINVALRDLGSLCGLLIAKGVITEAEYLKAIAEGMEIEAETCAEAARKASGMSQVRFG